MPDGVPGLFWCNRGTVRGHALPTTITLNPGICKSEQSDVIPALGFPFGGVSDYGYVSIDTDLIVVIHHTLDNRILQIRNFLGFGQNVTIGFCSRVVICENLV